MMSVDKFGRQSGSNSVTASRGPKGEGFKLTEEGDYDICNKRLCNVMEPEKDGDAVTFKRFKSSLNMCLNYENDKKFNAKGYVISNVGEPANSNDVASKQYVDSKVPPLTNNGWHFYRRRLTDIDDPVKPYDAVTLQYFNKQLPVSDPSSWDFVNKRLINVGDPINMQDVVTINYLVRILGGILFDIYKDLAPQNNPVNTMNKEDWINLNIVKTYFINSKTKISRK